MAIIFSSFYFSYANDASTILKLRKFKYFNKYITFYIVLFTIQVVDALIMSEME